MPALLDRRGTERIVACNLGHIDDALAVTLARFHHRPEGADEFLMFHAGVRPARRPVEWAAGDLRGVPKRPWLEPVAGQSSRWAPHSRLMESVVLTEPPEPVDLLVAETPVPDATATAPSVHTVRQGGHLLVSGPPPVAALPGKDWAPIDPGGHLFRRLTPPVLAPRPTVEGDAPTLARHHEGAVLIASYTNLARSLARRFSHRGERVEDLEQVALLALVKASDRYEREGGRPFGPFAAACITGELKRHFRDKMWMVRVPRSVQETYLAVRTARDDLTQASGTSPTIAEIADHLHATEESVLASMEAATNSWASSLDAPPADVDGSSVELPVIDSGFEETTDRDLLKQSISRLSPTEQFVLKRLFFDGVTQRHVAEELHVSQMQISRLKNRTLAQMRRTFEPVSE